MTKTMKNEKGISKLVLFVIIVIIIVVAIYWAKYFTKPMATVMMGGADQVKPAIEKAQKASDAVNRVNQITQDVKKKVDEDDAK